MEKQKQTRCLCPVPDYDCAGIEQWLDFMAQAGWHPVSADGHFRLWTFREGAEEQNSYAVQLKAAGAEIPKGWRKAAENQNMMVLHREDPEAADPAEDPERFAAGIPGVKNRMWRLGIPGLILLLAGIAEIGWAFRDPVAAFSSWMPTLLPFTFLAGITLMLDALCCWTLSRNGGKRDDTLSEEDTVLVQSVLYHVFIPFIALWFLCQFLGAHPVAKVLLLAVILLQMAVCGVRTWEVTRRGLKTLYQKLHVGFCALVLILAVELGVSCLVEVEHAVPWWKFDGFQGPVAQGDAQLWQDLTDVEQAISIYTGESLTIEMEDCGFSHSGMSLRGTLRTEENPLVEAEVFAAEDDVLFWLAKNRIIRDFRDTYGTASGVLPKEGVEYYCRIRGEGEEHWLIYDAEWICQLHFSGELPEEGSGMICRLLSGDTDGETVQAILDHLLPSM